MSTPNVLLERVSLRTQAQITANRLRRLAVSAYVLREGKC